MRRAPLPAYRSLSAVPFACRFRLPLLTPGPLPLAPSPFYSLPFTFTLRPRPVSRFQPSAGSPPFGQRRAPARARRPGATPPVPDMMRAGRAHSAHSRIRARRAPSECRAITRANMEKLVTRCSPTAPARNRSCQARTRDVRPGRRLRVPRDRAYARLCTRRHAVAQETHPKGSPMHESKSFDAGLARRETTATTRPARQASAAASTRRRHAARPRRRQAACRRQRAMTSPACPPPAARRPPPAAQSDANTRAAFSTATRMRTGTDESKRASSVRASVRECRRRARRTGPRPRQSAGVGRSCASLAASSPSPSLSSSASRRAGSPLVSRSVRARSASSR
ncbi:hydrolase, NUDIX family domain protein [Burkholderia pseudomallei TSV44]|nr:hydrolase, NUDIX family domain protein [Burkholderia pseudomallei TSV44]